MLSCRLLETHLVPSTSTTHRNHRLPCWRLFFNRRHDGFVLISMRMAFPQLGVKREPGTFCFQQKHCHDLAPVPTLQDHFSIVSCPKYERLIFGSVCFGLVKCSHPPFSLVRCFISGRYPHSLAMLELLLNNPPFRKASKARSSRTSGALVSH